MTPARLIFVPKQQPPCWLVSTTTALVWGRMVLLLLSMMMIATPTRMTALAQNDVYDGEIVSTMCQVEATTCLECVSNDCGWVTTGLCMVDCQYIADIPCYSAKTVPDATTAEQVCAVVQEQLDDRETCRVATKCADCVTLQKSNGDPCAWLAATETCETGECNILGCGETTCSDDNGDGDDNGGSGGGGALLPACQDATNCDDCLSLNCAWAASGTCLNSCSEIADMDCYSQEYFTKKSTFDICTLEEEERVDGDLCRAVKNCATCVTLIQSDQTSPCQWYVDETSDQAWCGTGESCNMNGVCGSTECVTPVAATGTPETVPTTPPPSSTKPSSVHSMAPSPSIPADPVPAVPPPVATIHPSSPEMESGLTSRPPSSFSDNATDPSNGTCPECLEAGWVWAAGRCQISCIPDIACYNIPNFAGQSVVDICTMAANDEADETRCRAVTDCVTCTSTALSDGLRTCGWYVDTTTMAWCGTGGCDMNGVCGSNVCPSEDTAPATKNPSVVAPTTPPLVPQTIVPVTADKPLESVPPPSSSNNVSTGQNLDLPVTSRTGSYDSTMRIGILSILLGFAWVLI